MITGHTHTTFNIQQIPKPLMITGHTHKTLTKPLMITGHTHTNLTTDTKAINDHWPHTHKHLTYNRYQSH